MPVSTKVKKLWFPFEDRDEYGFEDETAVACWLGKLFHFHQGRNVWGPNNWPFGGKAPNWSNTYPGSNSFCSELADAKAKIEKLRRQGSRWGIDELPVIVISGQTYSLIVGEINTDAPLSGFLSSRRKLLTLQDVGLHFNPRSPNSVFRIVSRPNLFIPALLPFHTHQSKSHGGGYFLNWHISVGDKDLRAVLALICRITKALQREGRRQ